MEDTISAKLLLNGILAWCLICCVTNWPAGSVIMCKLTAFVITEDGDIAYWGEAKWKWSIHANNQYFEFSQQEKGLHIQRSQLFIKSVFWALTGSQCKTRRRQVTGIPPTPVTIGSHTLGSPATAPPGKPFWWCDPGWSRGKTTVSSPHDQGGSGRVWQQQPAGRILCGRCSTQCY